MNVLKLSDGDYVLKETVAYPNGGCSFLYANGDTAIVIDKDIWQIEEENHVYSYSRITNNQNLWMKRYAHLYRFIDEDTADIDRFIHKIPDDTEYTNRRHSADRSESAEVSPLEWKFEENFANVYGTQALKYLTKEYGITDVEGNVYYLDYVIRTANGMIAVEENGVNYHHPEIIGKEAYRRQLRKQNTCTLWGIKLYRFSAEDCAFTERICDDIRFMLGEDTTGFIASSLYGERAFQLYEHQKITLAEIQKKRHEGIKTFLAVFPTASGKSKIVEEDIESYARGFCCFKALILAPNTAIIEDWKKRIEHIECRIDVVSYSYMERHYFEYPADYYDYICVDEAHHAVAPMLKRVIQHFSPGFLIGLTATDERLDHKKLESVFGNYEIHLSLEEAMNKDIVAKANVYRIETNLDLSHVRFNGKDYVNADLEKSIRVTSRNELIADVLKRYFCGGEMEEKQGVVFCVNIAHAKEMAAVLNRYGIAASAFTGADKKSAGIMNDFKEHKIRFLCAVQRISEGWDYPELGILVMARPTMSKVLYLQQIGRGLRRTNTKNHVFVIDVVDEYSALVHPCSMHAIFENAVYVPFGEITKRDYQTGDMIIADGFVERVEKITKVDIGSFEKEYGDYLNQEQLAREFFLTTGTVTSWIKKKKIVPSAEMIFGNYKIYLFSPDNVDKIREENHIAYHTDETIKDDFFAFLEERDYSLSYKMPFMLSFMKHMNSAGEAEISDVLNDYISFYQERIANGLTVDRSTCPYNAETLKDRKYIQRSMLTNPFEKFERKKFMYYGKELGVISLNHALFEKLDENDKKRITDQMKNDLNDYYAKLS